jgi:hypothetical protein
VRLTKQFVLVSLVTGSGTSNHILHRLMTSAVRCYAITTPAKPEDTGSNLDVKGEGWLGIRPGRQKRAAKPEMIGNRTWTSEERGDWGDCRSDLEWWWRRIGWVLPVLLASAHHRCIACRMFPSVLVAETTAEGGELTTLRPPIWMDHASTLPHTLYAQC